MYQLNRKGYFVFHTPSLDLAISMSREGDELFYRRTRLSIPPKSGVIYTEFDRYIIDGVRQATTGVTIRSNVSTVRTIIVTETITFKYMKFIRIPPDNWTSSSMTLRPTLSVSTSGSIDGLSTPKEFFKSEEIILNPVVGRVGVDNLEHFDIYKMCPNDDTTTTLTPGSYNITLIANDANRRIATMLKSSFPIDVSNLVYPDELQTNYFVMEMGL